MAKRKINCIVIHHSASSPETTVEDIRRWHVDGNGLDTVMEGNMVGLSRKISMVCWLNEDFEGGDFEIHKAHAMNENIIKPSKGTIIFFPAWTLHKVYPVTKGERFSLVTWFCGQPVK